MKPRNWNKQQHNKIILLIIDTSFFSYSQYQYFLKYCRHYCQYKWVFHLSIFLLFWSANQQIQTLDCYFFHLKSLINNNCKMTQECNLSIFNIAAIFVSNQCISTNICISPFWIPVIGMSTRHRLTFQKIFFHGYKNR